MRAGKSLRGVEAERPVEAATKRVGTCRPSPAEVSPVLLLAMVTLPAGKCLCSVEAHRRVKTDVRRVRTLLPASC